MCGRVPDSINAAGRVFCLCHDREYYFLLFYHRPVTDRKSPDRLALLPVIAGVSYEIIKLAGNSENPFVNLLSRPGMWVQNMTTKEPDDDMIEAGIRAVEAVFDWKNWQKENL